MSRYSIPFSLMDLYCAKIRFRLFVSRVPARFDENFYWSRSESALQMCEHSTTADMDIDNLNWSKLAHVVYLRVKLRILRLSSVYFSLRAFVGSIHTLLSSKIVGRRSPLSLYGRRGLKEITSLSRWPSTSHFLNLAVYWFSLSWLRSQCLIGASTKVMVFPSRPIFVSSSLCPMILITFMECSSGWKVSLGGESISS